MIKILTRKTIQVWYNLRLQDWIVGRRKHLREIWDIAWSRFNVITSVIADGNGRFIAMLFYFTIMVPFGIISALTMDPLRIKNNDSQWVQREPVPTDIESAREQG